MGSVRSLNAIFPTTRAKAKHRAAIATAYSADTFQIITDNNMGTVTNSSRSRFSIGDLVRHRLFGYRGVIFDIDPTFQSTDEWYDTVAKSRPPKNKPWYHVLVHGATHTTYVAEQNLKCDTSKDPISHPILAHVFSRFEEGRYFQDDKLN